MDNRAAMEKAASEAMTAAQQPCGDLRDLNDEQLKFVTSYWAQRPRVSNDSIVKSMRTR
jgi:hypothetical protein